MAHHPLVSIVILNWNGLQRVQKALPSLLSLEYPNVEYIFVDNGSTDGSPDYAESLLQASIRPYTLELLRENVGYSQGKSLGARVARGKYLWLIDNDIETAPDSLARLVAFMEKHPRVWTAMPLLYDGDERDKVVNSGGKFTPYGISHRSNANLRKRALSPKKEAIPISYPAGGVLFIRADWWKKSGGYDPIARLFLDDYDIGARTWIAGGKVALVLKARTYHHEDAPNDYMERADWKWREEFRGTTMYVVKNYQIRTIVYMLPLLFARHIFQSLKATLHQRRPQFLLTVWLSSIFSLLHPHTLRHISHERSKIQSLRQIKDSKFLPW